MNPSLVSRRDLHRRALALALMPWLGSGAQAQLLQGPVVGAGPRWQVDPFSLGVASGQPQAGSVVLWTRLRISEPDAGLKAQSLEVVCEVFADASLRQPLRQWRVQTDGNRGHSVHVVANGLLPGRPYWYRFVCGNAISPVGRARTSPAADEAVARLRMGLASCQHYEQGFFAAHREMAQTDLDLAVCRGLHLRKLQP